MLIQSQIDLAVPGWYQNQAGLVGFFLFEGYFRGAAARLLGAS